MRAVGRLATTSVGPTTVTKQALLVSSSRFCSSSGGGGGRGRGRGITSPVPGNLGAADDSYDASEEADRAFPPLGLGRGRGKPLPPPPVGGNVFTPWMPSPSASAGRGRPQPPHSPSPPPPDSVHKAPVFFRRLDVVSDSGPVTPGAGRGQTLKPPPPPETDTRAPVFFRRENAESKPAQNIDSVQRLQTPRASVLPHSVLQGMRGAGRGQTAKPPETDTRAREENRHLRRGGRQPGSPSAARLGGAARGGRGVARFEEGGGRRGGRGRGRERRRGRPRSSFMQPDDEAEKEDLGLLIGESVDENRLRERLGERNMSRLKEVVDEVCETVFPSEVYDGYLDALDTNFLVSQ